MAKFTILCLGVLAAAISSARVSKHFKVVFLGNKDIFSKYFLKVLNASALPNGWLVEIALSISPPFVHFCCAKKIKNMCTST